MPHIYDNIDTALLPALKIELEKAARANFCVGYFTLRGWRHMDGAAIPALKGPGTRSWSKAHGLVISCR